MSRRTERLSDLLQEELSELLLRGIKDPRLAHGLVTITEVDVSPDLHQATIYISHLGEAADRDDVLAALSSASRYLQGELVKRLSLRRIPDLHFRFDPTIERGARLAALINAVREHQGPEQEE